MTKVNLDNWQDAPHNRWGFWHLGELVPTAAIDPWQGSRASAGVESLHTMLPMLDSQLRESYTDALVVVRRGEIIHEQYFGGFSAHDRHVLMSVSKSLCGLVVGRLVGRGDIDVDAPVGRYLPELVGGAYGSATIQQVLDMTVAVDYSEDYPDPQSHVQTQDRVAGWRTRQPGDPVDTYQFLQTLNRDGEHGRSFRYVSAGTDVLAWVLERVTGRRYAEVLSTELWSPLHQSREALITVDPGGFAFANGGVACTARDLARVGELMLNAGSFDGEEVIPAEWIADTMRGGNAADASGSIFQRIHPNGSYRNQWWVTGDSHASIYAAGIYGQFIWVDPSESVVIVKFSSWPEAITQEWSRSHAELFRVITEEVSRL